MKNWTHNYERIRRRRRLTDRIVCAVIAGSACVSLTCVPEPQAKADYGWFWLSNDAHRTGERVPAGVEG